MSTERITSLRTEIDVINTELLALVARRLELSLQIGALKQEAGLPLYSEDRERDLLDRFKNAAADLDIDPEYVEELMSVVLVHSRAAQRKTNRAVSDGSSTSPGSSP